MRLQGGVLLLCALAAQARIVVDRPLAGSVYPADFAAPQIEWRDASEASAWRVELMVEGRATGLRADARGERKTIGEIDARAVGPTNRVPQLSSDEERARVWRPDAPLWESMKRAATGRRAALRITGLAGARELSRGEVEFTVSKDPVGAPIFYRDVPLMPSETQKGVIKPLAPGLMPLIAWRLKDVGRAGSRVVMEGIHTCANCHSFSRDGRTMGMDLDGPHNDKGLYTLTPVERRMTIGSDNVISWKAFRGQMEKEKRIGFMSQVSPDGRYVVTATQVEYHVSNFTDYRFLQAFYPTRGILAWYERASGRMRSLPGADDARFVHANATWSPDGEWLVFVRAAAADSYPAGRPLPERAGDDKEVQVRYDLYRIPFNQGRGGQAVPVEGASANGMSNSFPKVSPDGRWIVFVKSRNAQLMRPDGELWMVPASGGVARRMRCNTPLMNSWHSFSPNGRWMVFSSKWGSPYTRLWLTHIDEEGNDSPPVLIEGTTAANRAANIPEFVALKPGEMETIEAPATRFYTLYDKAFELTGAGRVEEALQAWTRALELEPEDVRARTNFAALLMRLGRLDEAEAHLRRSIELNPDFTSTRDNLGLVLFQRGRIDEAVAEWKRSLAINGQSVEARVNLGNAAVVRGRYAEAVFEWREALELDPKQAQAMGNLAWLLATCPEAGVRNGREAEALARQAVKLAGESVVLLDALGAALAEQRRFGEAVEAARRALALAAGNAEAAAALRARIALFERGEAYREGR